MTERCVHAPGGASPHAGAAALRRLRRRRAAERRFRLLTFLAVCGGLLFLAVLLVSIAARGGGAFIQHSVALEVDFRSVSESAGLQRVEHRRRVREALRAVFPDVTGRRQRRALHALLSDGAAFLLSADLREHPEWAGRRVRVCLPLSDDADLFLKGANSTRLSDLQTTWLAALEREGRIVRHFNWRFFTAGDSREPELAGIRGALVGSLLTLGVTLILCLPVGVAAAVHLEEFARRGRLSDFLEVNINNLAAVPSIVFGLLGLAVFLDVFGLPRSSPLVGGLVLGLMALPTLIIASRSALAAVPPSIRDAALALGATRFQVVLHHVLPQAMPGILTGSLLGLARVLGETAPLLMIGMVAYIADVPGDIRDPATVLPVQIYLWADSPERAFAEKTAGAILVLIGLLVSVNGIAVWLRARFETRGGMAA